MRRARITAVAVLLVALAGGCSDGPRPKSGPTITLADLNFLHGLFCPEGADRCRLPDRTRLLFDFVAARGCPDLVTLQEIWPPSVEAMQPYLSATCPFTYELVQGERLTNVDDETVLSRYPVVRVEQQTLYPRFRRVLLTRIDHPTGVLDVYSTHLASGSDGAQDPCAEDCPAECVAAGAATVRECQAVQTALFVERTHDLLGPALLAGDFNAVPGSFEYEQFVGRGWTDAYLAAGNPECDPATGIGCTSGRADEELAGLESPAIDERVRIDFIFVVPPRAGAGCANPRIEPGVFGSDGEGGGTRLFADEPNPFASTCGALPDPICWPSDHIGVQVELTCSG